MKRTTTLIASTVLALSATPLLAAGHAVMYDAANTLEGKTAEVSSVSVASGGSVWTSSGVELGKITDFDIDNQNRVEFIIDIAADSKFVGDRMFLTVDPEDVTVMDGSVAINATEDELFAQQNAGGSQDQGVRIDL